MATVAVSFFSKSTVDWSFYIGENDVWKGTGKRMLSFFLNDLFFGRDIEKIYAKILRQNLKSKEIHKHFGFTYENGGKNSLMYSLSKRKFKSHFYSLTE
ncbi:MAG: GNAT family N-acetyltransferase [Paracoccaceae bacterium]